MAYKSVTTWGDEGWTILTGEGASEDTTALLTRVAWPYRAVQLIGETTSAIPFILTDPRGNEYDNVQEWENNLGFWPHPTKDIYRVAASMVAHGQGYLKVERKGSRITALKFCPSSEVKPLYTPNASAEFVGFQYQNKKWAIEDFIYFWYADYNVDNTHPPISWPAKSAFSAAGVLYNLDAFISQYFSNGAVKAMLLGVPANTQMAERERIEGFFNKFVAGVKNAFRIKVINADDVKPTVIGGGLDELANVELSDGQKTDICVAFGVPKTRLFSDASTNATADADIRSMTTDTALPLLRQIIEALNDQLFARLGLRMVEQHEAMEIYQQNEQETAAALNQYVTAFSANIELALALAPMLGIDIPEDTMAALQAMVDKQNEPEPEPPQPAPVMVQAPPPPEEEPDEDDDEDPEEMTQETRQALRNWQRRAVRLFEKGDKDFAPFEHEAIPTELHNQIMKRLAECSNSDEIRSSFVVIRGDGRYFDATKGNILVLAEALNRLADSNATKQIAYQPQPITVNLSANMPAQGEPTVTFSPVIQPSEVINQISVQPTQVNVSVEPTPVTVANNITAKAGEVTLKMPPPKPVKIKRDANGRATELQP